MKTKITFLTLVLSISLINCKQKPEFQNYKFADKPLVFNCPTINEKLFSEAVYAFEQDIYNHYNKNRTKPSLPVAYSQFLRNSVYGNVPFSEIITPHTLEILNVLKQDEDLWQLTENSNLNYHSNLLKCISSGIKDTNLRTTLNALIETNSMSPKLFGTPLMSRYKFLNSDKLLSAYVAFDMYYAKMYNEDFTNITFKNTDSLTPKTQENKRLPIPKQN